MICEALCLSGVAGIPTEYFDAETRSGFCAAWNVAEPEYLAALLPRKTTPNGVFACKAHFHQYREAFGVEEVPAFCGQVRYVWLSRRDSIRQAVSYAKAIQTNQWASTHQSTNENPRFDPEQIESLRKQNAYEEAHWQEFFESQGLIPLRLFYEDFCLAPCESVAEILKHLEIEGAPEVEFSLSLEKQADDLSERWVEMFLAHQDLHGNEST